MEDKKSKVLIQARNIFEKLKTDDNSVLFTEEKITQHLFKKLKTSSYSKDKELVNLKRNVENLAEIKFDIDISTLYSIDGPFQLLHADVGNLKVLGKSKTHPKYRLVVVDLFTSKIYTYPMRSRSLFAKKLNKFYIEVAQNRNKK